MVKIARHKGTEKDYAIKMITKTVSETTRFPFLTCTFLNNVHEVFVVLGYVLSGLCFGF